MTHKITFTPWREIKEIIINFLYNFFLIKLLTSKNGQIDNKNDVKTMIFIPVLNWMVNELKRRFLDNNVVLTGVNPLRPKSNTFF